MSEARQIEISNFWTLHKRRIENSTVESGDNSTIATNRFIRRVFVNRAYKLGGFPDARLKAATGALSSWVQIRT